MGTVGTHTRRVGSGRSLLATRYSTGENATVRCHSGPDSPTRVDGGSDSIVALCEWTTSLALGRFIAARVCVCSRSVHRLHRHCASTVTSHARMCARCLPVVPPQLVTFVLLGLCRKMYYLIRHSFRLLLFCVGR